MIRRIVSILVALAAAASVSLVGTSPVSAHGTIPDPADYVQAIFSTYTDITVRWCVNTNSIEDGWVGIDNRRSVARTFAVQLRRQHPDNALVQQRNITVAADWSASVMVDRHPLLGHSAHAYTKIIDVTLGYVYYFDVYSNAPPLAEWPGSHGSSCPEYPQT